MDVGDHAYVSRVTAYHHRTRGDLQRCLQDPREVRIWLHRDDGQLPGSCSEKTFNLTETSNCNPTGNCQLVTANSDLITDHSGGAPPHTGRSPRPAAA